MKTSFLSNFNANTQKIWNQSSFTQPTSVQEAVFSSIMDGKDIIAKSPTGTGKTLAYLLPLIEKIDDKNSSIQTVILAPSRELVMQIYQEVQKWTKGTDIRGASFVGGANIKRQIEKLKTRPQIVIGSPGRILELIKLKKLKMHEVKSIVLDEGDQLLNEEHLNTVRTIVKSSMNDRQLLLFSATSIKESDQIKAMIGREPQFMTVGQVQSQAVYRTDHLYLLAEPRDRAKLLQKVAAMNEVKALVFVRDRGNMSVLYEKLKYENVSVGLLHSELSKREREQALTALRKGDITLLLSTDIAARGLDIEGLTHVIHYDFPKDLDQYIHRSGRTGRMGNAGTVVSFVTPRQERELKKFSKELKRPIKLKRIYKGNFVETSQKAKERKRDK